MEDQTRYTNFNGIKRMECFEYKNAIDYCIHFKIRVCIVIPSPFRWFAATTLRADGEMITSKSSKPLGSPCERGHSLGHLYQWFYQSTRNVADTVRIGNHGYEWLSVLPQSVTPIKLPKIWEIAKFTQQTCLQIASFYHGFWYSIFPYSVWLCSFFASTSGFCFQKRSMYLNV